MTFRKHLPQLDGEPFVTDGGLETYLIFERGIDLPEFAAFDLLKDEAGIEELRQYFSRYLEIAAKHGAGFVLESPTWRASSAWGEKLGYDAEGLRTANLRAIELLEELRDSHRESIQQPLVISGNIGPHDDGYQPSGTLTPEQAAAYHSAQISTFAESGADLVSAVTMTYAEEAAGIASAAAAAGIPVVISFTLETDARLPSGQPLGEAIGQVDAETGGAPAYYMINCAHPTHFDSILAEGGDWLGRIRGLRANASMASHAELDEATELDAGDPEDLAAHYARLREQMPQLAVLGGCCGTDHRHVAAIGAACLS